MVRIRRAEETLAAMVESGEVKTPCHLYVGQEAIAAGVCAALRKEDSVWGGHRSHGHYLAKGGALTALFAEVLGKSSGCSRGRGGSMHLTAPEQGIAGTVPIVAASVPLAAGAAMAFKLRKERRVAVAFFGDGAVEEGQLHETLNLASLYRLPLLLVCENNLYASHMHWSERRRADDVHQAGRLHSVPSRRVDGNDVERVYDAARAAVDKARMGGGPVFLECRTFRWRGHVGPSFDTDVGVTRSNDLAEWTSKDPIARVEEKLAGLLGVPVEYLEEQRELIEDEIRLALEEARGAEEPGPERVLEHVFVNRSARDSATEAANA